MTPHPVITSMRAENLAGNYSPARGDYPVRLLTRRTYSLSAAQITTERASSPEHVSYATCGRLSRSPPG
jgi:hypothetical protein